MFIHSYFQSICIFSSWSEVASRYTELSRFISEVTPQIMKFFFIFLLQVKFWILKGAKNFTWHWMLGFDWLIVVAIIFYIFDIEKERVYFYQHLHAFYSTIYFISIFTSMISFDFSISIKHIFFLILFNFCEVRFLQSILSTNQ